MKPATPVELRPEVAAAVDGRRPVVVLESTVIAHGLPWPVNLQTAQEVEEAVRQEGAVPATAAVLAGRPTLGLVGAELETLARATDVLKASRRDLGAAVAQRKTAATTVAGTSALAWTAGLRVVATGGIGGAHQGPAYLWDISADLWELARTPVVVVCAGAKSVLDIPRTLEILETQGVPVVGYQTDEFPAFYLRSSGEPTGARVDDVAEAAALFAAHWRLGGAGAVLAHPVAAEVALSPEAWGEAVSHAQDESARRGVRGKALTPFLLARVAERTAGQTLKANRSLLVANARLAARLSRALAAHPF